MPRNVGTMTNTCSGEHAALAPVTHLDPWSAAIGAWTTTLAVAGQRKSTRALRTWQMQRFARAMMPLGPWQVSSDDIIGWVGSHDWDRETLRSWRAVLRNFYRWAIEEGHLEGRNPAYALPKIKPAEPNPRPTPEDAYRSALIRADERVHLMLRLGAVLGMRRCEICRASINDLVRDVDGWTITVHGKGGKTRKVPCPDVLAAEIRRVHASNLENGHAGGWLFPGQINGHLSAAWTGRLVARTLPGQWTAHSLRHRFGTAAHEHERDLAVVQELLGHASIATTRLYVRVPKPRLRATVEAVAKR